MDKRVLEELHAVLMCLGEILFLHFVSLSFIIGLHESISIKLIERLREWILDTIKHAFFSFFQSVCTY